MGLLNLSPRRRWAGLLACSFLLTGADKVMATFDVGGWIPWLLIWTIGLLLIGIAKDRATEAPLGRNLPLLLWIAAPLAALVVAVLGSESRNGSWQADRQRFLKNFDKFCVERAGSGQVNGSEFKPVEQATSLLFTDLADRGGADGVPTAATVAGILSSSTEQCKTHRVREVQFIRKDGPKNSTFGIKICTEGGVYEKGEHPDAEYELILGRKYEEKREMVPPSGGVGMIAYSAELRDRRDGGLLVSQTLCTISSPGLLASRSPKDPIEEAVAKLVAGGLPFQATKP